MEGNDIAPYTVLTLGVMFEGLLVTLPEEEVRKGLFRKRETVVNPKRWIINEMPMKALIHLTTKLNVKVDVFTYLGEDQVESIERFLSRRGAVCQVVPAYDVMDLAEIVRFDRDIHQFYTPSEHDAQFLGLRSTVVQPHQTWGF